MEDNIKTKEITRDMAMKTLNDLIYEVANEGLPYDKDAQATFSKEEFYEFNNEFRMYGVLFGTIFVDKLMKKLDNIALDSEKEVK